MFSKVKTNDWSVMLHSLVNKVNFKINVWNLKDLKKHSFNCISHFVTGKEGIVPIIPQFRLAKIAGNILKTAGMVGFNDSFFLCRTFSLIQRLLASEYRTMKISCSWFQDCNPAHNQFSGWCYALFLVISLWAMGNPDCMIEKSSFCNCVG